MKKGKGFTPQKLSIEEIHCAAGAEILVLTPFREAENHAKKSGYFQDAFQNPDIFRISGKLTIFSGFDAQFPDIFRIS